jgi:chemotaxis protein MotB
MARDILLSDHEVPLRRVTLRRRGGWLGWLCAALLCGAAGAFIWYLYLPLRAQRDSLLTQLDVGSERTRLANGKLQEAELALGELRTAQDRLSNRLVQTEVEKEKVAAELERVRSELALKLEPEIQAGNVRLVRRGNDLIVDLADQILFDSGQPEVHEAGRKVLGQVAPTLAKLDEFTVQVAGHTDAMRVVSPAIQERFPTNWELSAARATNVVRFLQEAGKVPGDRLVAMGFGEHRPAASNGSADGRKKNRRIELVLIRK